MVCRAPTERSAHGDPSPRTELAPRCAHARWERTLAAFRPYPRDLATQLLPPGANDRDLEVAAEHLIAAHPELLAERLEQERRYGIDFAPRGMLICQGKRSTAAAWRPVSGPSG